jgi:hypothetical protein
MFRSPVRIIALLALLASSIWAQVPAAGRPAPRLPFAKDVPETPFDAPKGTFTVVVLPDTQFYAKAYPDVFMRQTEWIARNKDRHDIRFVLHEGDITDDNIPAQWEVARKAMKVLSDAGVPYVLVPGNHDIGAAGKTRDRTTGLNGYFSAEDYRHSGRVGYFEQGKLENTWHEFETPWGDFLVIALEFGPRDEVLEWANKAAAEHPKDRVIVLTHSYMGCGTERTESAKNYLGDQKGGVNGAQEMWNKLIFRQPNMRLVLSGHITGTGYRKDKGLSGNTVHQMLADFQASPNALYGPGEIHPDRSWGGGGYLRLLQFLPDGKTLRVRTYSPWYDTWRDEPDQKYEVSID